MLRQGESRNRRFCVYSEVATTFFLRNSMNDEFARRQELRARDLAAMNACVQHAKALLDSARVVHSAGHPNIAFHLAVLALEELGRRELIGLQRIAEERAYAVPTQHTKRPWSVGHNRLLQSRLKRNLLANDSPAKKPKKTASCRSGLTCRPYATLNRRQAGSLRNYRLRR